MLHFARSRPRALAALTLFGLLVASAGPVSAQPAEKKTLTFAEYDIWRSASGVTLSRDGQHVAYLLGADGGDGEAVVRHTASGKEYRFARGSASGFAGLGTAPRFTPDGKKVLLPLTPTKGELEKAKADKLKTEEYPKAALAVIDLASGKEVDRIAGVGSFQLGGERDGFLIYRKSTPTEPGKSDTKEPPTTPTFKGKGKGIFPTPGGVTPGGSTRSYGSDLFIRDLSGGTTRTILDVTDYVLSNDEKTLVYVVASRTEEKNGVYALNPKFGTGGTPVKSGPGRYTNLTWDEKQTKLAFFYDDSQIPSAALAPPPHPAGTSVGTPITTTPAPPTPPRYRVFVWDRDAKTEPKTIARVPAGTVGGFAALMAPVVAANPPAPPQAVTQVLAYDAPGLRKGWTLSGGTLNFSQDGTKLYVATAPDACPRPRRARRTTFNSTCGTGRTRTFSRCRSCAARPRGAAPTAQSCCSTASSSATCPTTR